MPLTVGWTVWQKKYDHANFDRYLSRYINCCRDNNWGPKKAEGSVKPQNIFEHIGWYNVNIQPCEHGLDQNVRGRWRALAVVAVISAVWQAVTSIHTGERCPKLIIVINIHFCLIPIQFTERVPLCLFKGYFPDIIFNDQHAKRRRQINRKIIRVFFMKPV